MREIILDTETTGLSARGGDRLVEIGCVEVVNRFATGRTFHVYVNPERDVPEGAFAVHGLSTEFLSDKPKFVEIADAFLDFVGSDPLVIHNADFDMGFIDMELERIGRPRLGIERAVNTLQIARRKFPGAGNRLDDLCSRFGIDTSRRVKHGALLDAELLAEVYLELTGGRQSMMELSRGSAGSASGPVRRTVGPRPAPLAPRLTAAEAEAHAAFVAGLGAEAVWKTYS